MAKSKERNQALKLRQGGKSIKDIARKLNIAKSTISLWCRDIRLTPKQIQRLHYKMVRGGYKGRMIGARMQYERRIALTKKLKKQGRQRLGSISNRDLIVAGAALYWGEGSKGEKQGVRLTNSDPYVIKFMLNWFKRIWNIHNDQIILSVIINKVHKNRVDEVEEYWSRLTKIPRTQFNRTVLIKSKNKKKYKNFPIHFGTLTIGIKRSINLHRQIMGMIDGLGAAA